MPAISNKTRHPLSVPLPGGKTLHLGPGKTGEITPRAARDARILKLVEAGEVELVEDSRPTAGTVGGTKYHSSGPRQTSTGHRGGDR